MKLKNIFALTLVSFMLTPVVFASPVSVDYDHTENFNQIKTYSWAKVSTANAIWDKRVKDAVDRELAAKGWMQVPSGGDVQVGALQKTALHQEYDTMYDGFGGRRFGGFGESTTSLDSYKVGTLIVDMYDDHSKQLIWRGTASNDLSNNPDKNAQKLAKEVEQMFKHFPPKAKA